MSGRRITLRITITLCIVVVTVATAISLLTLDYLASRESMARFTTELVEPLATLVGEKCDSFLGPVAHAAALSVEVIESDGAAPARFDEVEADWYSLLVTNPDLFYIEYGDLDGNFQMLTRRADGSLATQRIVRRGGVADVRWRERSPGVRAVRETRRDTEDYDPRGRPWFRGAVDSDELFWTPVYIHAAEHRPVITAARRVRAGGRVVGVTSVTIAVDRLSSFVSELQIADGGQAFIADREGRLIAGSAAAPGSPEAIALAHLPAWQGTLSGASRNMRFAEGGQRYLVVSRPLRLHRQADWLVAVLIPEATFLATVERGLRRNIILSGALTVLFVAIGLLLARTVGRELARVVAETHKLQRFDFAGVMPESRFSEIDQIFRTYDRLKSGLRAFEKYVPIRLVRMLLEGEAAPRLGGRVGTVTIFFSDVREFTALAERMAPEEVAELLGEYCQCVSDIIGAHGGTVDKFIGDGIMAFWNAPRPDGDHALHAVEAALRCRDAIAALPRAGGLFTRFGIHTSEVMIGNFGARDRFDYTLLGDGVNLASRLEGANKEYGTQILMSQVTADELGDQILWRRIDRVAVKGKSHATGVCEPICRLADATPSARALVRDYEAALSCYFGGELGEAERLFFVLHERFPDDGPTATMLQRCQRRQPIHELHAK